MAAPNELLHGTLETLVLKAVLKAPRHGYAIARWLEQSTSDALRIEDGSLYPALYRMQRRGWLRAEWGMSELGRKAKFYRITLAGRKRLTDSTTQWAEFSSGVSKVLLEG